MSARIPHESSRYDVVVAGARCAGAATALLLARKGLRVLVVDRGRYGTDTLSTHALMRGAVVQLAEWGLLGALEAAGTPLVRTTSFHYAEREVRVEVKARDGIPGLFAPRRVLLDRLLVDAARAAGAEVVYGLRVSDLVRRSDGRVAGVVVEDGNGNRFRVFAEVVVGADGLHSTVARLAGAEVYETARHAGGVVYGYFSGLANDGYHWHFRPGASVGRIPTNDGLTCVFAGTSARRFRDELGRDIAAGFARVLAEADPELADAVAAARRSGSLRGFPGQPGFLRQSFGPGFALVGDAAYFKDPITAHGITDALRDAELVACAVAEGSQAAFARYQETRDALAHGIFELSDRIASFEWDLPALEAMHLALSEQMKREVAALGERHAAQDVASRLSA
jgi:2-polyprenyl-6-methoxyphenol hydroxylase-like FAD-dependent oxidoreductase